MQRLKKFFIVAVAAAVLLAFGGCSVFGSGETVEPTLVNGTTAGNIVNYGFAVKDDDEVYFYFMGEETYEVGDIVKSNPDTGENSLVMHNGGLYMSIYDGSLYFCKEDGIYRAPMDTFERELVLEGNATQLQILDGQMFYIEEGTIKSATVDGETIDFTPIEDADCLNVFENKLYYINTESGQIWQADVDGENEQMLLDVDAEQFLILEGVVYYIDNTDGYLKCVTDEDNTETVISYACTGFNVNIYGIFYTREINGEWVCCNSDIDGDNEQVISDSEAEKRHMVCMFDSGAIIVAQEEFDVVAE